MPRRGRCMMRAACAEHDACGGGARRNEYHVLVSRIKFLCGPINRGLANSELSIFSYDPSTHNYAEERSNYAEERSSSVADRLRHH